MLHHIHKRSVCRKIPGINLIHRIAHAIPCIARAMRVASIRRFRHPYPQKSCLDRRSREPPHFIPARALGSVSVRKRRPGPCARFVDGVLSGPILHHIFPRERRAPRDPHRIDHLRRIEIHHDPLRMPRIFFAGKPLAQVRIALPIRPRISIGKPRIFCRRIVAAGRPAMRQVIPIGAPQKFVRLRFSRKISALVLGVAPRSVFVPVPVCNGQFRVLPVRDRPPSRSQRLF